MAKNPRRFIIGTAGDKRNDVDPMEDFDCAYSGLPGGFFLYVGVCLEEETEAHRPAYSIENMQFNLWIGDDGDDDED